jgi:hypothetical protein
MPVQRAGDVGSQVTIARHEAHAVLLFESGWGFQMQGIRHHACCGDCRAVQLTGMMQGGNSCVLTWTAHCAQCMQLCAPDGADCGMCRGPLWVYAEYMLLGILVKPGDAPHTIKVRTGMPACRSVWVLLCVRRRELPAAAAVGWVLAPRPPCCGLVDQITVFSKPNVLPGRFVFGPGILCRVAGGRGVKF